MNTYFFGTLMDFNIKEVNDGWVFTTHIVSSEISESIHLSKRWTLCDAFVRVPLPFTENTEIDRSVFKRLEVGNVPEVVESLKPAQVLCEGCCEAYQVALINNISTECAMYLIQRKIPVPEWKYYQGMPLEWLMIAVPA